MGLIGSLDSGVSALQAFTKGIEVIGNNVANVDTYGYKTGRADYADQFSQVLSQASGTSGSQPSTTQIGSGSRVSGTTSDFSQGSISTTGVKTDLAIDGNGFFVVRDYNSNEKFVTRAGNFTTDANGYILTPDGQRLQGLVGGAISYSVTEVSGQLVFTASTTSPSSVGDMRTDFGLTVANGGLTIVSTGAGAVTSFTQAQVQAAAPQLSNYAFDSNGHLTFNLSNGDSFIKGQVLMTSFTNPNALAKAGNNLFTNFTAAGPVGGTMTLSAANNTPGTNGLGNFKTASLELSNVDLTAQFADLITVQRSFQAASRIITVSDDILQEVVNLKR